mgnify:FL=1
MNKKTISIVFMALSFLIFGLYVWWASNYNNLSGGWGAGIWLVAVGVFLTGVITFFDCDKDA